MKRVIFIGFLLLLGINSFAQFKREVIINPVIDTSAAEFSKIFRVWEDYMDALLIKSNNSGFLLKKMDIQLKSYWSRNDTSEYFFPDLYYSFNSSYGLTFYPMHREYFLGISKRDTNLYELKTMFLKKNDDIDKGFPSLMISVPVIKDGDSYKLSNKFSLNKRNLKTRIFPNITYYYPRNYAFNDSLANLLEKRIENFKTYFQINKQESITYMVADNITQIASWFGIDHFEFDYNGTMNRIEGRACKNSNMILSGGGGENYMHEIIHILLKHYDRSKYNYFEEGIACFFGEHVGYKYEYHAKRLKKYLEQNSWVDLSKSLSTYYEKDSGQVIYGPLSDTATNICYFYHDKENISNFPYIIHAVLCDIAYRMDPGKVKELFLCKAENEQEFYGSIEKVLGIRRTDLDKYLRCFLDNNFSE